MPGVQRTGQATDPTGIATGGDPACGPARPDPLGSGTLSTLELPPALQGIPGSPHHPSNLLRVTVRAESALGREADLRLAFSVLVHQDLDYRLELAASFVSFCLPTEEITPELLRQVLPGTARAIRVPLAWFHGGHHSTETAT